MSSEQEQPKAEPKPKTLVQKLADIVAEIDNVDKRGRNEFQKYAYVKAADVAWLVRKALSERNVYLVADVIEIRNYEIPAKEGHMQAVDIKMEFSFFDGDNPETDPIVLHSYGTGTDKGDKAVYKAMTGALKYGLRHAFLIPDESDPEADISVDKAVAQEVGVRKAKAGQDRLEHAKVVDTLFYTLPESHNGHFAEFLNLEAFGSALNEVEKDGLNLIFKGTGIKKTVGGGALLAVEKLDGVLKELSEASVKVKKLEAA